MSQALATKEIGSVIGLTAATMSQVNDSMDVKGITKMVKDFAKESDKLEMKSEMMGDAMDMMGDPALEENADEFYSKILEEQALVINNEGIAVPREGNEEFKQGAGDDNLADRLNALKD